MILPTFTINKVVKVEFKQNIASLNAEDFLQQGDIEWYRDGKKIQGGARLTTPIEAADYGVCLAVNVNNKYPFAGRAFYNAPCNKFIVIPGKDRAPIT